MTIPIVDEPCHQAFGELKNMLYSSLILKFVEFDKTFQVRTGEMILQLAEC